VAEHILALRGISKRFGAVQALSDVDFHVDAGEVVALVGDNGAGKSTLIKVIAGVGPANDGVIEFDGKQVSITKPQDATDLGIATVYQDLALCDNLDVAENLFLGREELLGGPGRVFRLVDHVDMEKQTSTLLKSLSVKIPSVRIQVASLSGGQRQSVAIARSLIGDPKVVVLDEPTAALGVAQTAQVLDLIVRLRERGLGVIVISHNLADVFAVADRIAVLRLGRNGGEFKPSDATREQIVGAITGADSQVVAEGTQLPAGVVAPASATVAAETEQA
jgi:D-xylose transport system ATP-binding protein